MRNITIIGAGRAGLQLGIGLLGQGHQVTIYSNRTADQIARGKILSSQSMCNMAVTQEREQGLLTWDDLCPPIQGMHVRAGEEDVGVMVDFSTLVVCSASAHRGTHLRPRHDPAHVLNILGTCQVSPKLAQQLAAGFNDPRTMANWYFDEQGAQRMIDSCADALAEA